MERDVRVRSETHEMMEIREEAMVVARGATKTRGSWARNNVFGERQEVSI